MQKLKRDKSAELFEKAKTLFPGGVNSPVRAFKSVDGPPIFFKKAFGPYVWDEDDNAYIDFCCSWGPLILGHMNLPIYTAIIETASQGTTFGAPTRLENELAELILNNIPFIEKIRFVSSGTEAVMSALRLARGYTKRDKVLKFEGCYHGHSDSLLVKAGSGLATLGSSSSAGVPESFANETIVVPLNDIEALREAFEKYKNEIACAIIEPIPANNGLLLQDKSFLLELRKLCSENGTLLFFDEVISGFRVAFGGASELYGIKADIYTYGKIIGGGLPVGAYGASAEIMSEIAPDGPVYQAGTLSGNPVAMAAGLAQLKQCLEEGFYHDLAERTKRFAAQINAYAQLKAYNFEMVTIGSIFWLNFDGKKNIQKSSEINADMSRFKKLFSGLVNRGVYIGPSGYEVGFVSKAHTEVVLNAAAEVFCQALDDAYLG